MRDTSRRGRPRRNTAERVLHLSCSKGLPPREIAARVGCSKRWVNRVLAEHRPLIERLSA